jgi:DNA-binding MarR family transcriptional regulator
MTDPDDRVAAWRALLLAHARVLRAIEDDLLRAGAIPLTWYDVLLELNAAPGRRLRMAELADTVVLSRTRVSRLVDELQAAGLVQREPCPDDRRVTWAALTEDGRAALRRAAPIYLDSIDRHFTALLGTTERRTITRALDRVVAQHDRAARVRLRR